MWLYLASLPSHISMAMGPEGGDVADRLRTFYAKRPPDLDNITDLNKRHFRFLLPNGRFYKIKDVIRTPDDLQRWLVRLKPLDVYYSTSTYLNPTSVATRPRKATDYWGPGNVILANDIAFDLDRRPLSVHNLERARKDAVRLLDLLVERGYRCKYAAFSGSKGFHLLFEDPDRDVEPDLHNRERSIIQKRKVLVDVVSSKGIKVDVSVTVDTRRIIRLPGTINSKTGYSCQILTNGQLRSPVADWLDDIARIDGHKWIPIFTWEPVAKPRSGKRQARVDEGHGLGYTTFITSPVLGIKGRHAVLISLPKAPLNGVVRRLERAQAEFDLTDIYVFDLPHAYQAICLKTVQRNRYQKILDFLRSPLANQLRKYDRVSLRMGPLVDGAMNALEPPAEFVACLECPIETRNKNHVSRGHLNFLMMHGISPLEYPKVHGNGEFKLVDAEIRL